LFLKFNIVQDGKEVEYLYIYKTIANNLMKQTFLNTFNS